MYGIDPADKNYQKAEVMRLSIESVALLLSPIVPHFAEELWEALGFDTSILLASWPSYREDALVKDELLIVVQVNGKLRSKFNVDADADDGTLKEMALSDERVLKFVDGKPIKKIIVVKGKLVNIVV
jgi:leucyl-tRNA synthetase